MRRSVFSHVHILSRSKRSEEREFYLRMATQSHWLVRRDARQIDSGLLARCVLNWPKLSAALRELHSQADAAAALPLDELPSAIGLNALDANDADDDMDDPQEGGSRRPTGWLIPLLAIVK